MNSQVKTLSGAKPCVFPGKVASGVAEVGLCFAGLCVVSASAGGRPRCAQDCSESSVCASTCSKLEVFAALLEDEVGKMCTRLQQEHDFI